MAFKTNLMEDSDTRTLTESCGVFTVIEFDRDPSVAPDHAIYEYYKSAMDVRKRQVIANLNGNGVILQAGAMQMMVGDIKAATDVKGAGDLFKKALSSKVTNESAIKPRYTGSGQLLIEPTYKFILFEDLGKWNGGLVIEDGSFLACDDTVNLGVVARNNISSAALGGEGLFNTCLTGSGIAVLESPVPREELIVVDLQDDVLKVDGNMAVAWSKSLNFTVERVTKTLIGSAASGEGLVNVYRGTGRVLVAPIR